MKNDDTITEALRKVRLFQGLDTAALRRIAAQPSPHSFPSGATVIDADTSGRFGRLYVIASGTAEALVNDEVVATFGPNDYFGESMIVNPCGEVIGKLGKDENAVLIADCDMDLVDKARIAVPTLRDMRGDFWMNYYAPTYDKLIGNK